MASYYLIKSEPYQYSIDDLKKDKTTIWDGVHNYQAINNIKKWEIGDRLYFYHSVKECKIVGIAEVADMPFLNTNDQRYSFACKISFVNKFNAEISDKLSLKQIKDYNQQTNMFDNFGLIKQSRLSVVPCPPEFIKWVESQVL